ncbi:MAG: hypothetical protein O7D91_07075 [Planctomycetota bacterium]|nr:hypothetical protein [Planctomycetota bacterium]
MPALKVHVRPPHKHKGLLMLGAVYGLACGCPLVPFVREVEPVFNWLANNVRVVGPMQAVMAFMLCVVLAPFVVCAAYMARSCQHNKSVYLVGQVAGSSYVVGIFATACLLEGPPPPQWTPYLLVLGMSVGGGVAAGLLGLLFNGLHVNFISVLLEQDGTLCVECGYCVAHSPSDRCPECGVSRDTPIRPLGRIYACGELLAKHSGKTKYAFCALIVCAVSTFLWHEMPVWKFSSRFETDDSVVQNSSHRPGGLNQGFTRGALDISRPIENDALGRVLIIQQYRRSYFGSPRLQVRVGHVVSMPGGGTRTFRYLMDGVPRIVCELDERQTEHAMENGIPGTLVRALIKAADDAGWVPSGAGATAKPDVVVSADGHFPALENDEK